jgi:hypothetical protein
VISFLRVEKSNWISWPLKMKPPCCLETSDTTHPAMQFHIPQEERPHPWYRSTGDQCTTPRMQVLNIFEIEWDSEKIFWYVNETICYRVGWQLGTVREPLQPPVWMKRALVLIPYSALLWHKCR